MDIGTAMTLLQTVVAKAGRGREGHQHHREQLITVAKCFGMALAIGIGVFAPGFTEGLATAKAVEGIARNPGAAA